MTPNNTPLPEEVAAEIADKAEKHVQFLDAGSSYQIGYLQGRENGYISGATDMWHQSQQKIANLEKKAETLLYCLQKIAHSPVPANESELLSWYITAKNMAGGAISELEAQDFMNKEALFQWNSLEGEGKEVSHG